MKDGLFSDGFETSGHGTSQSRPQPSPNSTSWQASAPVRLVRVSAEAQDAQLQHDALTEPGWDRIYTEKMSMHPQGSRRASGPASSLDYLRHGDTLVV